MKFEFELYIKKKKENSWLLHLYMFTLNARKELSSLISINFPLATNPTMTWWTKTVTIRDILKKKKKKKPKETTQKWCRNKLKHKISLNITCLRRKMVNLPPKQGMSYKMKTDIYHINKFTTIVAKKQM